MTAGHDDRGVPGELTPEEVERLGRLVSGDLPPAERDAIEREVLASARLTEALYADAGLRSALAGSGAVAETPSEARVVRGRFRRPWLYIALPIAAAATVLLLVAPRTLLSPGDEPGTRRFRGGSPSPATVVRAVEPVGVVSEPPARFVWTRDAEATGYRLEILDDAGRVVFSAETTDTAFAPPPEVAAWEQDAPVRWRVASLDGPRVVRTSYVAEYARR